MNTNLELFTKTSLTKYLSFKRVVLFLYPLFLLLVLENLKPESSFFFILVQKNFFVSFMVLTINYLLFFSLVYLVFSLTKNMFTTSILLNSILLLFYIVNYYRWINTGSVFTPEDLSLAKNIVSIVSFAKLSFDFKIFLSIISLFLSSLFFYRYKKVFNSISISRNKQICLSFLCLINIVFFFLPIGKKAAIKILRVEPSQLSLHHEKLYANYGNLFGFTMLTNSSSLDYYFENSNDFQKTAFEKQYSSRQMINTLGDIENAVQIRNKNKDVKPNVIVIMSETFWDPSVQNKLNFSDDPIPNFRKEAQVHSTGNVISPSLGGQTANVEYELLLMDSMFFYRQGEVPYEKSNKIFPAEDKLALPKQFKQNGYSTVAVHPYNKSFYNRESIYPNIGFDKFIAEDDMPDAKFSGKYISDDYFVDSIINEIESANDPLFLFGISMENHFPYEDEKYLENDFQIDNTELSSEELIALKTYTKGVNNADASLGKLINYLETQSTPTLLLFYGDHLPILASYSHSLYNNTDFISTTSKDEWGLGDYKNMYSTPYLLWDNFQAEKSEVEDISPLFFGPLLLKTAGLEMNTYSEYLLESMNYFHSLHSNIFIDNQGQILESIPEPAKSRVESLYYIHLDRFKPKRNFGKQYIYDQLIL